VIHEREIVDLTVPIWETDFWGITDQHILRLISERVEEGQHLDYKQAESLTDKKVRKGLLKDFCAMANSGGGILLIGFKEDEGRPVGPSKGGLQNISKPDKHIMSLTQVLNTEFGKLGPQFEMRSVEVMRKIVVLAKIFPTVIGPVRPKEGDPDLSKYPFRKGRITAWHSGV
jgi:predicted HTH transcriptional regulator